MDHVLVLPRAKGRMGRECLSPNGSDGGRKGKMAVRSKGNRRPTCNRLRQIGRASCREAAKAKWQFALKEIEDRLATASDDAHLILLKSDKNSALGRNDDAAAGVQLFEQLRPNAHLSYGIDHLRWIGVKLRLGQRDVPLRWLEQHLRDPHGDFFPFMGRHAFIRI